MSAGRGYEVGQHVEYQCRRWKKWIPAVITKVEVAGVGLSVRGTLLPTAEISRRLRVPSAVGSESVASGSDPSAGGSGELPDREGRVPGQFDHTWENFVAHWVKAFDGKVLDILAKFEAVCQEPKEKNALKERMLEIMPKCQHSSRYAVFETHPRGENVIGLLHPSMITFSKAEWSTFPIYPSDFVLEVLKLTTDGLCDDPLKVTPSKHCE